MTPRTTLVLLLLACAAAAAAAAPPVGALDPADTCATTPGGATACGYATVEPLVASSTAEGEATASVHWTHCIVTYHHMGSPNAIRCNESTGPAYAGVVTAPGYGCAYAYLDADGQRVATADPIC